MTRTILTTLCGYSAGSIFLIPVMLFFNCSGSAGSKENAANQQDRKNSPAFARRFAIQNHNTYKELLIFKGKQRNDTLRFALTGKNQEAPASYPQHRVIQTPLQSIVILSATHLALTNFFDASNIITGISKASHFCHPTIQEKLKQGTIIQVGGLGALNPETVINQNPDLLMSIGRQNQSSGAISKIKQAGIPVLPNLEWLEPHPLGRAEWLKVMGALLNRDTEARKRYSNIKARYQSLKKKTSEVKEKPTVLSGYPYKGTWYVPGGKSYKARLIRHAGGNYPWKNKKSTGSIPLDLESVYAVGLEAGYWIINQPVKSRQNLLETNQRLKEFKAFRTKNIYTNQKKACTEGGNLYWEKGILEPDKLLADYINILHPSLLSHDSLCYHQKLSEN